MSSGSGKTPLGQSEYAKGDRYHHRDLREAMIQVAQQLLEAEGPGGWTVRAAARAAGVSSGAPYRHFADKEALLAAVAARGFEELREQIHTELEQTGDTPLERFQGLGAAYITFALARPGRYSIMFGRDVLNRSAHPTLVQSADQTFETLLQEVQRGQREGLLRDDREAQELATAAWSCMHGLADLVLSERLPHADTELARTSARIGRLLFEGLLKR